MSTSKDPYKMIVLTRRIKVPGIVETMSEQVPEVRIAFAEIDEMFQDRMKAQGQGEWRVISHAQNIHNGILIVSFLLEAL